MDIEKIVSEMTLEEKAGLTSGFDAWLTKSVDRLGLPAIRMSDGPHGLRIEKKAGGVLPDAVPAVCYPAGCLLACSFDPEVAKATAESLAEEALSERIDIVLGPALNTKRSPLCGRNFEYLSEDPLVSGTMAAAYVKGAQSKGVGVSAKHFFANSQEYRRNSASSEADERTLRELFLANFETVVKQVKPWTVMASYNKINGTFATEQRRYIEDVLYKEWGFDGFVVSDWGATHDRMKAVAAGTALTMPSDTVNDGKLAAAVQSGELEEAVLDRACKRILHIVEKARATRKGDAPHNYESALAASQRAAENAIVLLKNDGNVLPLSANRRIAFIGAYANAPRYQGGGSSHINSYKVISVLEAVSPIAKVEYAQGFNDNTEDTDEALLAEAVNLAQRADVAIMFAGLPEIFESEGFDRRHMRMPICQNELIAAIAKANPNTVVVLHNGAPVEMPWADSVRGIVEAYLGGDAVGAAMANILYGKVNPSGRLAETFPKQLEDTPSYLYYGGEGDKVEYREGVFVGYRYYETKKMDVLFPFGHGLSYTTFTYSNLTVDKDVFRADTDTLTVAVDVKNAGALAGQEVVQLYVAPEKGKIIRPAKELRAFRKIALEPGDARTVSFTLDKRAFAYWDMERNDWCLESGKCALVIGKNAHDVLLSKDITVDGGKAAYGALNETSLLGDVIASPAGQAFWNAMQPPLFDGFVKMGYIQPGEDEKTAAMTAGHGLDALFSMPVDVLCMFVPGYTKEALKSDLAKINATNL